jgi:hypothetical protein
MNILFNLVPTQPSVFSSFHGGGLYGEIVFFALSRRASSGRIFCYHDPARPLKAHILEEIRTKGHVLVAKGSASLDAIIRTHECRVYYSPGSEDLPDDDSLDCKLLGTIHGPRELEMFLDPTALAYAGSIRERLEILAKLLLKPWIVAKRWMPVYEVLFRCPRYRFIAVSEHTKHSLLGFFPYLKRENIKVFYSPLPDQLQTEAPALAALPEGLESGKYFLMTSGNRWVKNNLRAAMALDQVFTDHPELPFRGVVAGVSDPSVFLRKLRNPSRFLLLNYVERDLLESLHKNAYAYLYPTLNEGFGYPPVESMKYAVPVAASGITSVPEVCGEAALYFNPYSVSEIKNRILQLLDPVLHERLRGLSRTRHALVSQRQQADLESLLDEILTP